MFDIVLYGDPILRKKARQVTVFNDGLRSLVENMKETMSQCDGLGLAAPQIGHSVQVVTIDATKGEKPPYVLVNPELTFFSKEEVEHEEGCLSFPDIHLNITRPAIVSIKAFDEFGKPVALKNADDILARALQHEIDHLNGILIVDHISVIQRKMLSGKLKKISRSSQAGPVRRATA